MYSEHNICKLKRATSYYKHGVNQNGIKVKVSYFLKMLI